MERWENYNPDDPPADRLSAEQWIAYLLEDGDEMRPSDLAAKSHLHPTTIHRTLKRLLVAKIVTRRLGEFGHNVYYSLV